jgi:type IV pilus assembly protein PilO
MDKLIEQLNKASNPVKYGGLAAVIVLLTIGNYFGLISDLEDTIVTQKAQQAQLELTLAEKQAIAQNLNEKRLEMDRLEQKLAEALTELPEKKDIDELLAQLNDVGRKSGLEISAIEPGAEASVGFYNKIPIKMTVQGNYHEIAMFMQEVANLRRIVNVSNIRLSMNTTANSLAGDKVLLAGDFQATTFRFPEQGKADKGKGKAAATP